MRLISKTRSLHMNGYSHWVYLSPHLDDVVLSCGGLIWQQIQKGDQVEIWTVFAGDRPVGLLSPFAQLLHTRWQSGQDSARTRRLEDVAACKVLNAVYRHFDFPDCIYRFDEAGRPVITREEDLFQPEYHGELTLTQSLTEKLTRELPKEAVVVMPYGFGNHIDHQLTRFSADKLQSRKWLYADYPYSAADARTKTTWLNLSGNNYQLPVDMKKGLIRWQDAVAAYETQLSTFWTSLEDMRQKISDYCYTGLGSLLRQL